jgi:2-C-methyl-D-erythritol 4-phosphate cytidylyltransferase
MVPDLDYTDEAQVMETAGIRVKVIPGEITNIKITEKEDIDLFVRLL